MDSRPGVLSAGAAAARLLQPIDEPVTLVDCGSGSTRALFFKDDGLSHVSWEKSTWRGTPQTFLLATFKLLKGVSILLGDELD